MVFLLDCSRGMSPWFYHAALGVLTRVRKRSQSHASHSSKFSSVPLSLQPASLNPHWLCWRTNCDLIVKMCFLKPNSQIFGSRRTPCSALTNTHVRDTDVTGELDHSTEHSAEHSFWRPDCSGFLDSFILDTNQVLEIVRRFWREQETCKDLPADWTCKPGRRGKQNVTTIPQIFSKR